MEVGVDAYASVAEVNAYLSARNTVEDWTAADTAEREAAIVEATSFLDAAFSWKGNISDTEQTLGWPRDCAYDREGRLLEGIPQAVKNATAELANLALGGRLLPMSRIEEGGAIIRDRIGDVEVEYDTSKVAEQYAYVRLMLRGIGSYNSANNNQARLLRS